MYHHQQQKEQEMRNRTAAVAAAAAAAMIAVTGLAGCAQATANGADATGSPMETAETEYLDSVYGIVPDWNVGDDLALDIGRNFCWMIGERGMDDAMDVLTGAGIESGIEPEVFAAVVYSSANFLCPIHRPALERWIEEQQ
jgi:hypothetical protein